MGTHPESLPAPLPAPLPAHWPAPAGQQTGPTQVASSSRFQLDPAINNGNRTEWNPIRSVFLRVINKSDICEAGVQFVYHDYDYRQN